MQCWRLWGSYSRLSPERPQVCAEISEIQEKGFVTIIMLSEHLITALLCGYGEAIIFYLLAHLLLCPSISLSICPPVHLSIYSSVFPSFFLSIRLFIQFSIYPSFVHLCSSCLGFSYPFLPPCTHSYHSSAQRLWGGWPAKSSTGGRDPQLHDQVQWLCTCRLLLLSSRVLVDNYPSWCLASRFHLEWICHLLHQCS